MDRVCAVRSDVGQSWREAIQALIVKKTRGAQRRETAGTERYGEKAARVGATEFQCGWKP